MNYTSPNINKSKPIPQKNLPKSLLKGFYI